MDAPEPPPAQNPVRNFTMADLLLMALLFGAQLAAAQRWLTTFQSQPEPYLIVLLAGLSLLAAGTTLLLVSKAPHVRSTTPLRFLLMIVIDLTLFFGFPVLAMLLLTACLLVLVTFPISVPLLYAARETVRLFLKGQAERMSKTSAGGAEGSAQSETHIAEADVH